MKKKKIKGPVIVLYLTEKEAATLIRGVKIIEAIRSANDPVWVSDLSILGARIKLDHALKHFEK